MPIYTHREHFECLHERLAFDLLWDTVEHWQLSCRYGDCA